MWRALRIAILWLLAAALPLQGSVAATLRVCGPGHDRMAVSAATVAQHDHAAHHHDAAVAAAHDDGAALHLHKNAQHKCSACAACSVSAALPAATLRFEAAVDATAPPPPVFLRSMAFLTDGPDRPPRLLLA